MEPPNIDQEMSDDEIYFGKLTIKEIKKMFCNRQGPSKISKNDPNASLRLIETHSQPNLRSEILDSPVFSSNPNSPALGVYSDESFIKMENRVTKLCISPTNSDNVELNNTLDIVDYILNHGPNRNNVQVQEPVRKHVEVDNASTKAKNLEISPEKEHVPVKETLKITENTVFNGSPNYYTPTKSAMKKPLIEFVSPSPRSIKSKTPLFKTPANPSSLMKPSTPRFTRSKTNVYQHIASPIAAYIKNCPQVPLVKNVLPKKPLPGASCIPKLVRNPSQDKMKINKNKENIDLPCVAYISAKKTKLVSMIKLPDEDKLPQSQWVKTFTPSLKPSVIKHESRQKNTVVKRLLTNQEESFDNLPCQQAEVSYCTEKSAFKSTNKRK
ncbi:Myosin-J heavy chain [Operophtera brumata]|uniref:Myosin-J heavy chain n=1 Tax=Operophtera brumata TaxID=104452 RepID=A0A0L7LMK7_OPEBR|nr:Myosin-J heavy chain [Operophtera brumata]